MASYCAAICVDGTKVMDHDAMLFTTKSCSSVFSEELTLLIAKSFTYTATSLCPSETVRISLSTIPENAESMGASNSSIPRDVTG